MRGILCLSFLRRASVFLFKQNKMCHVNDKDNSGYTHQNENNTQPNEQQPLQQQVSFDDNGFILTEQERIAAEIARMERSRRLWPPMRI